MNNFENWKRGCWSYKMKKKDVTSLRQGGSISKMSCDNLKINLNNKN